MTRGFTLVEVVVALVVLEIGLLGVLGTVLLASRTMTAAEVREGAVLEAQRVADSLGTDGLTGPGARPLPWGRISWGDSATGVTGHVVAIDATGDTLVTLQLRRPR